MNEELPPEDMEKILEAIYTGQKLQACKLYKAARGTSLMEAKEFVEQLTEKLKQESPESFREVKSAGCASVLLLAALGIAASLLS